VPVRSDDGTDRRLEPWEVEQIQRKARRRVDSALSAIAGVVYRGDRADIDWTRPARVPPACEDLLLRPPGLDWVADDEWSERLDRLEAI